MASRKRQRSFLTSLRNPSKKAASREARRRTLVEKLEQRQLLAGPQLIGIQPDEGSLIVDGTVRDVSPRLLTFRFDEDQVIHPSTTDAIRITRAGGDGQFGDANDVQVDLPAGSVTVNGSAANEVLVRFPGALPDDDYRIEVFAFDDADAGIVGLRNTDASGAPGELLIPSTAGTRKEQVDFELQLGAVIESVVPQPVVRLADGTLTQRRDQIVVYFNEDELFVEDYPAGHALAGSPTERSAENPRFYQLLYTRDTVRTTDDDLFLPTNVDYDAATNTATLTFADDISNLAGAANVTEGAASISGGTFRLRVGTAVDNRAELVVTPTNIDVVASVTSDLRTGGAASVTFRARAMGEAGNGITVRFERTAAAAPTARVENDRDVVIDLGSGATTVADVRDAMLASPEANALLEVVISDVAAGGSLVGAGMEFVPALQVVAAGDTLQSAFDVGVLGQGAATLTSLVIAGAIEPQPYLLELPGGNDDPGHRELDESAGDEFVQHLSELFSPDVTDGVTTIPYNFQRVYGLDTNGASLINGLNDPSDGALQRERIREALGLWASQLGVQFTETANQGITFVLGDTSALPNFADVDDTKLVLLGNLDFAARVDPTFDSSMLIMDADRNWETLYGQDFLRTATAAIGVLLGLEEAAELPSSTLMNLANVMLSGNDGSTSPEPVFPGNFDVLHGQYLYNPDSNDVDLYRFQVDLGDDDKVGLLTAETFAERLADSSLLDSTLTLYQQVQASVITDFAVGTELSVEFEAVAPARLGNRTQIQFVEVTRLAGDTTVTVVPTSENSFRVEIPRQNANTGLPVVTVGSVLDAINNDPFASTLVRGTILKGDESTDIGGTNLSYSPLVLTGGKVVELSRNDDYFSEDSLIRANLGNGVYYIGVAASGNDHYDPTITQSGFGGRSQGAYELQLVFEAQVDEVDVIRDLDGDREGVPGTRLDGNADGVPGDVFNYWFQSRPLQRQIEFTARGDGITPFSTIQVVGGNGNERTFQFVPQGSTGDSRFVSVIYNPADTPTALALKLSQAINSQTGALDVSTTANGTVLTFGQTNLAGQLVRMERAVELSSNFAGAVVHGRTIFVDKSAGPNADGTVLRPFDNISNSDVPNAFDAAQPGDIVRIVGNGGADGLLATEVDNVPYEFGPGLAPGEVLDDGLSMKVPQGVTTMIDAGAVLRFRNSLVSVGSSDLLVDRSGGALQVLGTPRLLDANGNLLSDDGSVIFTSTRDRTAGQALAATQPAVSSGDWGGIVFRSDFDDAQGRLNLEDEGIFLQYVNHADIRYGGSSNVKVDGNQGLINSVQIIDMRPTVTFNTISNADAAAMSAAPNSFEETNYQAPRFQQAGAFTSDYERVGPDIHRNTLVNNSLNGLFVRVDTLPGQSPRQLSLAGRFDDVDIVHIMSENLIVTGTPGGPITDGVQPSVNLVNGEGRIGGTLAPGDYVYRMTFVDANGFESLASNATGVLTVAAGENAIQLANLPQVTSGYQYRRIYRAATTGPNAGQFFLVDELDASSTSFFDNGRTTEGLLDLTRVGTRGRLDASLVFDPGLVTKLFGSRIELGQGTQLLAEGLPGQEVVFTSILDDRYGSGGAFDTNNDGSSESPVAGNWGGIYVSPTAHVSLDNSVVAYGGGLTRVGGTFKAFSALEIQQGTARVTDSIFENNANGQGGQGPTGRFGRLANTPSTIFVRGSQPTIVGNTFINNSGSVIDIDVNSFTGDLNPDKGRQTGSIDRLKALDDNYGPLVRRNRLDNNSVNGMEIRTTTLTTESIWDDTDIVHVVFGEITTENLHSSGGLRLQSRADESLVVKFQGSGSPYAAEPGAGLTAEGTPSSIEDRIGGTLHILGQPGFPVVLTSFLDDTVGAGVKPDGSPQTDTNNDDLASRPEPNDWRGILLDEYSNDNNVETILETESTTVEAPGINGTVNSAQVLGDLAANVYSTDELLRLGFTVHGYLSNPTDVDVYNFTGEAGTMVWFDIDKTTFSLDTVIELLDSNGNVLVRSDNSTGEVFDPEGIVVASPLVQERVGSLLRGNEEFADFGAEGLYEDYGTINMRDAGFRVALPGATGSRSSYSFRVRSASVNPDDAAGGTTRGAYSVQLRLQEDQEFGGSVVRYADIRYANNGVHARGLMVNSPLLGDAQENEQISGVSSNNSLEWDLNQTGSRPQYLGNLLASDDASISVGGALSFSGDVDFYKFRIDHTQLPDEFDPLQHFSTVFDIDYADGLSRPDTSLAVFWDPTGEADSSDARLVLWSQDGNIAEDQTSPLGPETGELFERGSQAPGDPFIGPVSVPASGVYYVAVVSDARQPVELVSNALVRLDPLPSVARIADDQLETIGINTADAPAVPLLIPRQGLPAGWTIDNQRSFAGGHGQPQYFDNTAFAPDFFNNESLHYTPTSTAASQFETNQFNLGGYTALDEPYLYFNYYQETGASLQVNAVQADGTLVPLPFVSLDNSFGSFRQARISLESVAGQDNLRLQFVAAGTPAAAPAISLDDFVIGFAERGERVGNATQGVTTFVATTSDSPTLSGEYQLEIRPGAVYSTSQNGTPRQVLTQTFDTNDRLAAETVTLIAPSGSQLSDGDFFELSDGANTVRFEFNSTGSVQLGSFAVPFSSTDTDYEIAQAIREVINDPNIQDLLNVEASSSGGIDIGPSLDNRIDLVGPVEGDFIGISLDPVEVEPELDGDVLAEQVVGDGILINGPATAIGDDGLGIFSGGQYVLGLEEGVLLSTGDVLDGQGPNFWENSTGTASGSGDADLDAATGVTSTDTASLEFEFQIDSDVPSHIYMQAVFASEEYRNDAGPVVNKVAVLLEDVGSGVVYNLALTPAGAEVDSTAIAPGSPLYVDNSPTLGGDYLRQLGYDGFTQVLSFSSENTDAGALQLQPGDTYRLKFVVGDSTAGAVDSALFIGAHSLSTTPPPAAQVPVDPATGRVTFQAILRDTLGDRNVRRTQSQLIIDSSKISHVQAYGIWSEPAERKTDPIDTFYSNPYIQDMPLGNTGSGAVRNLPALNNSVTGGLAAGIHIVNNIIDDAQLAGINIQGELQPFIINPNSNIPDPDTHLPNRAAGDLHIGDFVSDGATMTITSGNHTVVFEFEEIHALNGYNVNNIPIYYRSDLGARDGRGYGYNKHEWLLAIREAILSSSLVQNDMSQLVNPVIGNNILGSDELDYLTPNGGTLFREPALYIYGASSVSFSPGVPASISRAPVHEGVQPFARIVNNTIVGRDGTYSQATDNAILSVPLYEPSAPANVFETFNRPSEPNDTISTAVDTRMGVSHAPELYRVRTTLGDSLNVSPSQDVDFYQVNLDVGDRLYVDVDTNGSVNTSLRLFNSAGQIVTFYNAAGQPETVNQSGTAAGETPGVDPYIDYTATAQDTYYVAVSADGNESYDALSLGQRLNGSGTGEYEMSIEVAAPRQFVITALDGSSYSNGQTFTIYQIPDRPGLNTSALTFEFTTGGGVAAGNVPINFNTNFNRADMAQVIAAAIDSAFVPGIGRSLLNYATTQTRLPDGRFGPIDAVEAAAFGGAQSGGGLTLLTNRPHHAANPNGTDSPNGYGYNDSTTSQGGNAEKYVLVSRAAKIEGNIAVTPAGGGSNVDQIVNEMGVLATHGASPTLLNNVFINLNQAVFREGSYKGGEVIVGASLFQGNRSATNVGGANDNFNEVVAVGEVLLEDPLGDDFLPVFGTAAVDSAVDSLDERGAFSTFKGKLGITVSPVLAPDRDNTGQLRADGSGSQSGVGGNVFKDRGALDLADFVGPVALADLPADNDAEGIDTDPTVSFLQLSDGSYGEFRIQLIDTGDASDPFPGSGIDDDTVVGAEVQGLRKEGATLTLFENGNLLTEGVDYKFVYDSTKNQIRLTPLAGVWRNDRSYRIQLNNTDRFVVIAPSAATINDGDQLQITDENGGVVSLEFEAGYEIEVPEILTLIVPQAGTGAGGIRDSERFTIDDGVNPPVTFEFDLVSENNTLPGSVRIPFAVGDTPAALAAAIANVVAAQPNLDVDVTVDGTHVQIGAEAGATLDAFDSGLLQAAQTLAYQPPLVGAGPGGIQDGETFTINDGTQVITFEFETGGGVSPNNVSVPVAGATTNTLVSEAMRQAIAGTNLNIVPTVIDGRLLLGLPADGSATAGTGLLRVVGLAQTPVDGTTLTFTPTDGAPDVVFELNRSEVAINNGVATPGAIAIDFTRATTADQLAVLIADAIKAEAIAGVDPNVVEAIGNGVISVVGEPGLGLTTVGSSSVLVTGEPGVAGFSNLQVFGALEMILPSLGGISIANNSQFALTGNDQTIFFEYTQNGFTNNPNAVPILYSINDAVDVIVAATVTAINGQPLGITATTDPLSPESIFLGQIDDAQVDLLNSGFATQRGTVSDGDYVVISQGTTRVVYEFNLAVGGGGLAQAGAVGVTFEAGSAPDVVASALAAAIRNNKNGLRLDPVADGDAVLLNDVPGTNVDVSNAPTLLLSGVPGQATPIMVNRSFTSVQIKEAIIDAINRINDSVPAGDPPFTNIVAVDRGGNTLFVENAQSIGSQVQNYFLQAIADEAGQHLKPNRPDNTTQFTFLMPDVALDFGDAPDPVNAVRGRYPTLFDVNGARHVIGLGPVLGTLVDGDANGQPTTLADGDNTSIDVVGSTGTTFIVTPQNGSLEITLGALVDGDTLTLDTGIARATFEIDTDGLFDEDHFAVAIQAGETAGEALQRAFLESPLRPADLVVDGATLQVVVNDEDGVSFASENNPEGVFNNSPGFSTPISVTVTGTGVLDAWIDFNGDGDWSDPGEKIIGRGIATVDSQGASVSPLFVEQTDDQGNVIPVVREFAITIPANTAVPLGPLTTYARFRLSAEGDLSPTGLALSGEVEDYAVRVLPGQPPTVPADYQLSYDLLEDTRFDAFDADGSVAPASNDGVLAQITDPDGDPVEVFAGDVGTRRLENEAGEGGTLVMDADGTFSFEPDQDFAGTLTFNLRVTDVRPVGREDEQLVSPNLITVTLNVATDNDPPRPASGSPVSTTVALNEDVVREFTVAELTDGLFDPGPANESDQALIIESVGWDSGSGFVPFATEQGGSLEILGNGTLVRYTPPLNLNGVADRFIYTVEDVPTGAGELPALGTEPGTVVINLNAVNDPPIANDDNYQATEDDAGGLQIPITGPNGILNNDTSGPADEQLADPSVFLIEADFAGGVTTQRGGTVTYVAASGSTAAYLRYQPATNFSGDDSFTYRIRDAEGLIASGTVNVEVVGNNDPADFIGIEGVPGVDSLSFEESKQVPRVVTYDLNTWFNDPEGDPLTFNVTVDDPSLVQIQQSGPNMGQLQLTFPSYAAGMATLTVEASNVPFSPSTTTSQDIAITLIDTPDLPRVIGTLNELTVQEDGDNGVDGLVVRDLSTVFDDPDGDQLSYRVISPASFANSPLVESVTFVGDQIRIQLREHANGSMNITIGATDDTSDLAREVTDSFILNVTPVADVPTGVADFYNVSLGGLLSVQDVQQGVLNNDFDPDGNDDALVLELVSTTTKGTLTLNDDGTFVYQNESGGIGETDTFTYRLTNAAGSTAPIPVTINLGRSAYQNPIPGKNFDVTADGFIAPDDALQVINLLNRRGVTPVSQLPASPPPFYDVDGNGVIEPLDALLVINELNLRNRQGTGAQGESANARLATTSAFAAIDTSNLPQSNQVAVSEEEAGDSSPQAAAGREAGVWQAGFVAIDNRLDAAVDTLESGHRADTDAAAQEMATDQALSALMDEISVDIPQS